jgi:hypothetical protein
MRYEVEGEISIPYHISVYEFEGLIDKCAIWHRGRGFN